MTWLPKFAVCLSYYDRFRLRSDAFAALFLALQIFPLAIAIAVATGVSPIYGVLCAAIAGLLASVFGDSKIRVTAPNVVFVAVASSIVAREGIIALVPVHIVSGNSLGVFWGNRPRSRHPNASASCGRRASQSLLLASKCPRFLASVRESSSIHSPRHLAAPH